MKCRISKMSLKEYNAWVRNPLSRQASLPSFFENGVQRTRNVLKGVAKESSYARWRSFRARHGALFCDNPTFKRAIALRNWGFDVKVPKRGR